MPKSKGVEAMKKTFTTTKGLSVVFSSCVLLFQSLVLACNIAVYHDSLVEEPV